MYDIQPSRLSDEELVRMAYTWGYDKLPPAWVEELAKRLEQHLDTQTA